MPTKMDNVYLASQYARKEEMRGHKEELESYGVTVTSRWLTETFDPKIDLAVSPDEGWSALARVDLEDIIESDTMIFFAEDQNKQPPRGGRHVEFGFALAQKVRIVVVGEKENLFHYLPEVTHYASFGDLVKAEFM